MFNFTHIDEYFSSGNSFDIWQLITLIIAIVAVISSIYSVYLTKQMEVKYDKFKYLCLDFLENKLNVIEQEITNANTNNNAAIFSITNHFSDLSLIVIEIRNVYPKLDVDKIQNLTFEFTDLLYKNTVNITNLHSDFLITKIKIYSSVYDYALEQEMIGMKRLFRKRRSK